MPDAKETKVEVDYLPPSDEEPYRSLLDADARLRVFILTQTTHEGSVQGTSDLEELFQWIKHGIVPKVH